MSFVTCHSSNKQIGHFMRCEKVCNLNRGRGLSSSRCQVASWVVKQSTYVTTFPRFFKAVEIRMQTNPERGALQQTSRSLELASHSDKTWGLNSNNCGFVIRLLENNQLTYSHIILACSNCTQAIVRLLQWQKPNNETKYIQIIQSADSVHILWSTLYVWHLLVFEA